MTVFIASIALSHAGNWQICKRENLWGVPKGKNAEKAARMIKPGDVIFIWLSGGVANGGGLKAKMRARGSAYPANNVPWPDAERYSYTIATDLIDELRNPIPDYFPGNRTSERFSIQNMWITWGFWHGPGKVP